MAMHYWARLSPQDQDYFFRENTTPAQRLKVAFALTDEDIAGDTPFAFRYQVGQRVKPYGKDWGTVVQRRYTERLLFSPVVEYAVELDDDTTHWWFEPDVVSEEEIR
jgi:hypothetical protein